MQAALQDVRAMIDRALLLDRDARGLIGKVGYGIPNFKGFDIKQQGTNFIAFKGPEPEVRIKGERNLVMVDMVNEGRVRGTMHGDDNVFIVSAAQTADVSLHIFANQRMAYIGPRAKLNSGNIVLGQGSKPTSVIIGASCLFAQGVALRATDSHAMIDCATGKIISEPSSIVIEPYVWLGEGVKVLKGARIGYGAIVGSLSLVTASLPPRTASGGIPARVLRQNVTWLHQPDPTEEQIQKRLADLLKLEEAASHAEILQPSVAPPVRDNRI